MGDSTQKSLPLAIGLNLLLPGVGYMYLGRVILGFGAMILVVGILMTQGLLLLVPTWLVLNVIMALDMFILHNKRSAAVVAESTRKCPFCAETIQREARICRYCQRELTGSGFDADPDVSARSR
jgi:hypothetical protein